MGDGPPDQLETGDKPHEKRENLQPRVDTILDKFRLPEDDKRLFDHTEAFRDLARSYLQTAPPEVLKKREITLLYPGAGNHIAIFEVAAQILESQNQTESIHLIFTEISQKSYKETIDALAKLAQRGFLKEIEKRHRSFKKSGKGEEYIHIFEYQTASGQKKQIKLTYALNRSEPHKGDHDYYRQSYVATSDILVSHDSSDDFKPGYFLGSFILSVKQSPSDLPKAFFVENDVRPYITHPRWDLLPGRYVEIDQPYGCREDDPAHDESEMYKGIPMFKNDHLGPARFRAVLYFPDMKIFKKLSKEEIKVLLDVAHTVSFPDQSMFNPGEGMTMFTAEELAGMGKTFFSGVEKIAKIDPGLANRLYAQYPRFLAVYGAKKGEKVMDLLGKKTAEKSVTAFLERSDDEILHFQDNFFDDLELIFDALKTQRKTSENLKDLERQIYQKLNSLKIAASVAKGNSALKEKFRTILRNKIVKLFDLARSTFFKVILKEYTNSDDYKKGPYSLSYTLGENGAMVCSEPKLEASSHVYDCTHVILTVLKSLISLAGDFGIIEIKSFVQVLQDFIKEEKLQDVQEIDQYLNTIQ